MRKFRKTYIEITNQCNLSCDFCPGTSRPAHFMDRNSFRKVLSNCKDHSQLLHFHVFGEPTLHPDIGLFLDICEEAGLKVHIVTNGLLLDRISDKLLGKPSVRSFSISLQSMSEAGTIADFEEYLHTLHRFADKAHYPGAPWITLRLWNVGMESAILTNETILKKIASEFSLDENVFLTLKDQRGFGLSDNLYINTAERFEWPELSLAEIGASGYCLGLRDQVAVLVDGTVVPCCLDVQGCIALGNILNDSLETILASDRAIALRDGFSRGAVVEPLCKKCTYRLRFNKKKQ